MRWCPGFAADEERRPCESVVPGMAAGARHPADNLGMLWGKRILEWPERPTFGNVRDMRSENTAREMRARDCVKRYRGVTP